MSGKLDQKAIIDSLVIEVSYLVKQINSLELLINASINEDKEAYVFQILSTIDEYKTLHKELSKALEIQFEYEKENNLPRNFNYIRLYKKLQET